MHGCATAGEVRGARERDAARRALVRSRKGLAQVVISALLVACGETDPSWPERPFLWEPPWESVREPAVEPTVELEPASATASQLEPARGTSGPEGLFVVFDQSKQTLSSPYDTSFVGLSMLADVFEGAGARVSLNHQPLDLFLPAYCGPGRVLVLGIPWRRGYSGRERAALDACLEAGSGVLVFAEHDDIYGHAVLQNELLEAYGVRVLADAALAVPEGGAPFAAEWALARAIGLDGESVRVYLAAPLELQEGATPLLRLERAAAAEHAVVGALVERGPGTLAVLGDLELFWNMTPDAGLRSAQNAEFARSLLRRLTAGLPASGVEAPVPQALGAARAGRVLFVRDGGALIPDRRPNGITRFARVLARDGYTIQVEYSDVTDASEFELVVVAVPRTALRRPEGLLAAPHLLLIADGQQDLLRAEPQLAQVLPLEFPLQPEAHPLDVLTRPLGFAFSGTTLLSASDRFAMRARWSRSDAPLWLSRSSWIEELGAAAETQSFEILARAPRNARAALLLSPVHQAEEAAELDLRETPERPTLGTKTEEGMGVIARSARAFALADLELITDGELDTEGGRHLLAELRAWLRP